MFFNRNPSGPASRDRESTESPVTRNKGRQMCYPLPQAPAVFGHPSLTFPGRRELQREAYRYDHVLGMPLPPDRIKTGEAIAPGMPANVMHDDRTGDRAGVFRRSCVRQDRMPGEWFSLLPFTCRPQHHHPTF
uniref:Uncharacterized protein n=1 Tax=Leptospirillum ferriphilum TaxID=178606 RepID=A0A7C3QSX2_9BACT